MLQEEPGPRPRGLSGASDRPRRALTHGESSTDLPPGAEGRHTHTHGWDVHRRATQTCFLVPRVVTHIQPETWLMSGLRHNLFKEKVAKDGRHI